MRTHNMFFFFFLRNKKNISSSQWKEVPLSWLSNYLINEVPLQDHTEDRRIPTSFQSLMMVFYEDPQTLTTVSSQGKLHKYRIRLTVKRYKYAHSFIHSFVCSFVHSFIHSFICICKKLCPF